MKIYVVKGMTGEYSDHCEWLVKAFTDENKAKDFVEKASAIAMENFNHNSTPSEGGLKNRYTDKAIVIHPLDPKYQEDYTGTDYTYFEVELEGV